MSDIERAAFEQAVADKWSDSYKFTRFGDEDYFDEVLEGIWRGWQASRQAASVPEWIKCSDRLPAEYDGDFEGLVWVNDRDMTLPKYAQSRVRWSHVRGIAEYTHWMPTGFRRPQPPKQEGE